MEQVGIRSKTRISHLFNLSPQSGHAGVHPPFRRTQFVYTKPIQLGIFIYNSKIPQFHTFYTKKSPFRPQYRRTKRRVNSGTIQGPTRTCSTVRPFNATRIDPRPQNCTGPHKPITKTLVSFAILIRFIRDWYRWIALFNALLTSIIRRRYSPRFENTRTIMLENIRNQ
jgi:hypothetical protein